MFCMKILILTSPSKTLFCMLKPYRMYYSMGQVSLKQHLVRIKIKNNNNNTNKIKTIHILN